MTITGALSKVTKKVAIALLILVLLAVGIYTYTHRDAKTTTDQAQQANTLVKIPSSGVKYPAGWKEASEITAGNQLNGVITELNHSDPTVKLLIREEAIESNGTINITGLADQIASSLQEHLDGFRLVSKGATKVGSYQAAQVTYTATSNEDNAYHANKMFVVTTPHKSYYITYNTPEANLSKVSGDITVINESIASFIKTRN